MMARPSNSFTIPTIGAICDTTSVVFSVTGISTTQTVFVSADLSGVDATVNGGSSFTVGPLNTGPFTLTVNCNEAYGVVHLIGTFSGGSSAFQQETFCKGDLFFVSNIDSTIRGNDFDIQVGISPEAIDEVELTVTIDSPLVIPGGHRLTIAAGESVGTMHFISPLGPVGPVNINFHSRKLFDYGPFGDSGCAGSSLTLPFTVLGTMTTTFFQATLGDGVIHSGFVTIDPPAGKGGVDVAIDYSNVGNGAPDVVHIPEGQNTGAFKFLPNADGSRSITLTAQYYVTLNEQLTVVGTIFTDTPALGIDLILNVPKVITVTILPTAPPGGTTVTISASNNLSGAPPSIFFAEGESVIKITVTPTSLGNAEIVFRSAGFIDTQDVFKIVNGQACPTGSILAPSGRSCARCPGANFNSICSGQGECVGSTLDPNRVRCDCSSGVFGVACESFDVEYFFNSAFDNTGKTLTLGNVIFGFTAFNIAVPSNLLPDASIANPNSVGPTGNVFVDVVDPSNTAFDGIIDAVALRPTLPDSVASPFLNSFFLTIVGSDNTVLGFSKTAGGPATLTVTYDSEYMSPSDFTRSRIYYWSTSSKQWIPAVSTCSSQQFRETYDISTLTYSVNVCAFGQFQVYIQVPNGLIAPEGTSVVVDDPAEEVLDQSSNVVPNTGFAPNLPHAQPDLNGDDGIGLVPYPRVKNGSAVLSASLVLTLLALFFF